MRYFLVHDALLVELPDFRYDPAGDKGYAGFSFATPATGLPEGYLRVVDEQGVVRICMQQLRRDDRLQGLVWGESYDRGLHERVTTILNPSPADKSKPT